MAKLGSRDGSEDAFAHVAHVARGTAVQSVKT